jgi:hypothetical protein
MTGSSSEIEQAVSRTLCESLEKLQRTTEELSRAVGDLAATCAGARPADSLAPMLRAQTAAASLAASLDVLSRFITAALQPDLRSPAERRMVAEALRPLAQAGIGTAGESPQLQPLAGASEPAAGQRPEIAPETVTVEAAKASEGEEEGASAAVVEIEDPGLEAELASPDFTGELPPADVPFDILALPPAQQELHRRASRVAKVSMQDIRMLRPDDVKLGREKKDICERLRNDIEKAHKEYDRRFHTISAHPVDYFYNWMVEILGDGNPETLGAYPYPSPVLRR